MLSNMVIWLVAVLLGCGGLGSLPSHHVFETKEVDKEERTYHVSLQALGQVYCSGVVIGETQVLTTATCLGGPGGVLLGQKVDPLRYRVRAGSSHADKGGREYQVVGVVIHEQFDVTFELTPDYDIALLKVASPLGVPAVLPLPSTPPPALGREFVTSGWGRASMMSGEGMRLYKSRMMALHQGECEAAFALLPGGHVTERMLCTLGFVSEGDSPSLLDLGAPITLDNRLLGLGSGGTSGTPRTYTNTVVLAAWIQGHSH